MDNNTENGPDTPGNPGDWFLETLGIDPNPEGSKARDGGRSQTAEMSFTIDSAQDSSSTPTPLEAPGRLPEQTELLPEGALDEEDLSEWKPQALARQVESKRNFRWWIVITLAVIAALIVAAVIVLPRTVDVEAREEADDYAAVLIAMQATLPDIQQVLATATEPATSAIDLLPLSAQLTLLDAAAAEVVTRASRELPDTLPLLPRGPLEDLEPSRALMRRLGAEGSAIVQRISATISYRTTLDGLLLYPSLPVRADPSQIDALSVSLAETLAQSAAVLSDLPVDPAFDTHRQQVGAALESYETWQSAYLDALRRGDQSGSSALIADANALRLEVFAQLVPALATVRGEVDAAILELNTATTQAILGIPSP